MNIPFDISTPSILSVRGLLRENMLSRQKPVSSISKATIEESYLRFLKSMNNTALHHNAKNIASLVNSVVLNSSGERTVNAPSSFMRDKVLLPKRGTLSSFRVNSSSSRPSSEVSLSEPPTVPFAEPNSYPMEMGRTLYEDSPSSPLKTTFPSLPVKAYATGSFMTVSFAATPAAVSAGIVNTRCCLKATITLSTAFLSVCSMAAMKPAVESFSVTETSIEHPPFPRSQTETLLTSDVYMESLTPIFSSALR